MKFSASVEHLTLLEGTSISFDLVKESLEEDWKTYVMHPDIQIVDKKEVSQR